MKEATGEANMTVVTIVLIGAVVAIATPIITGMLSGMQKKTCCTNYGGAWKNGVCTSTSGKKVSESKYWDSANKTCIG